MLRGLFASSRYIVLIAVLGTFVASLALLVYEALVVGAAVIDAFREPSLAPKSAKVLAVGLIEVSWHSGRRSRWSSPPSASS